MIRSFANAGTADIWNGTDSKAARGVWPRARRKLDDLNQIRHYGELKTPSSNRLHRLRQNREDQWAIAVNVQYRICFRWKDADAFEVEITDYH